MLKKYDFAVISCYNRPAVPIPTASRGPSMKRMILSLLVTLSLPGFLAVPGPCRAAVDGQRCVFNGTSDASAGAALTDTLFVMADDENNFLRVYDITAGLSPIKSFDLTTFLMPNIEHPEADIEGAARVGNRIYWITSHGRNKDGKVRPSRYRFFATDVLVKDGDVSISPVGVPCRGLVRDMLKDPALRFLQLEMVTLLDDQLKKNARKALAPKKSGLNIEGLAAAPADASVAVSDDRTLYIALRNPTWCDPVTKKHMAIVIPLTNPADVVDRHGTCRFGKPLLWDLNGLGVRSMEYSPGHGAFFIIAGRNDSRPGFLLYRWSGIGDDAPRLVKSSALPGGSFAPEAMFVMPAEPGLLWLLSDDGAIEIKVAGPWQCVGKKYYNDGYCQNKYLLNPDKKTFGATTIKP